eukprot:g6124.t1
MNRLSTKEPFLNPSGVLMFLCIFSLRMMDQHLDFTKPSEKELEMNYHPVWVLFLVYLALGGGMLLYIRKVAGGGSNYRDHPTVSACLMVGRVAIRLLFAGFYVMVLWSNPGIRTRFRSHMRTLAESSPWWISMLHQVINTGAIMPLLSGAIQLFLGMSLSEIGKTSLDRLVVHYLMCADLYCEAPYSFILPGTATFRVLWFGVLVLLLRISCLAALYSLQFRHMRLLGARNDNDGGNDYDEDAGTSAAFQQAPPQGRTAVRNMASRVLEGTTDLLEAMMAGTQQLEMGTGFMLVGGFIAALWAPSGISILENLSESLAPLLEAGEAQGLWRRPSVKYLCGLWGLCHPALALWAKRSRRKSEVDAGTTTPLLSASWAAMLLLVTGGISLLLLVLRTGKVPAIRNSLAAVELAVLMSPSIVLGTCGLLGTVLKSERMRWRWSQIGISSITAVHTIRLTCGQALFVNPFIADQIFILADAEGYFTAYFILLGGVVSAQAYLESPLPEVLSQILCCTTLFLLQEAGHMAWRAISATCMVHMLLLGVFTVRKLVLCFLRLRKEELHGSESALIKHWAAKHV